MKQKIIDTVFDNWCDKEFNSEILAAMDNAVKNPNEDTIFQLVSITEASAFKDGFHECLKLLRSLFTGNPEM